LTELTGVAAILRFPIPGLDDDEDEKKDGDDDDGGGGGGLGGD